MELETLEIQPLLCKVCGSAGPSVFDFELPGLIRKMKQSLSWAKGELNSIILLKNPEKKIVLTAVHKGTEIISFQSNDSITFRIIEGKLMFHTWKKSESLAKGQSLTFNENIRYSLTTREETVFLLTILQTIR